MSPVEGEALFLPSLKRLYTLYPGAYARGTTAPTPPGPEEGELGIELGARIHTGAAGVIYLGTRTRTRAAGVGLLTGGGDPYPIRL